MTPVTSCLVVKISGWTQGDCAKAKERKLKGPIPKGGTLRGSDQDTEEGEKNQGLCGLRVAAKRKPRVVIELYTHEMIRLKVI